MNQELAVIVLMVAICAGGDLIVLPQIHILAPNQLHHQSIILPLFLHMQVNAPFNLLPNHIELLPYIHVYLHPTIFVCACPHIRYSIIQQMMLRWIIWMMELSTIFSSTLLLNSTNFHQALQQFTYLFVYFNSPDCSYCSQFDHAYAMVAQHLQNHSFHSPVQLAKLTLNPYHLPIFQQYSVDSVPTVLVWNNSVQVNITYHSLQYDNYQVLEKWVLMVVEGTPIVPSLPHPPDVPTILYPCSHPFASLIYSLSFLYLQVQFVCLSAPTSVLLLDHLLKRELPCHTKDECQVSIHNGCNRGVQPLSALHLQQLFHTQPPLFILVTNKDSESDRMLREYKETKQRLQESCSQVLPIFSWIDVAEETDDAIRVMEWVGNLDDGGIIYPYPMLAYVQVRQGVVQKYVYQVKLPDHSPTHVRLPDWVRLVMKGMWDPFIKGSQQQPQPVTEYFGKMLRSVYSDVLARVKADRSHVLGVLYTWKNHQELWAFTHSALAWFKHWQHKSLIELHLVQVEQSDAQPGVVLSLLPALTVYDGHSQTFQQWDGITLEQLQSILLTKI